MRKLLTALLVLVGVFGIALAGLLRFYAPSRAEKTPLNLDIIQVATGPAKLLNSATGEVEDTTLNATRRVRTDSAASNSDVTVVQETLCLVKAVDNPPECVDAQDPRKRLVAFTTDRVAADRKTAESVNDPKYGANINGDTSVKHTGLTYKWPFNAKKTTYKFFDPASSQSPDAKFVGTEKYDGMELYKYEAVIDNIDLPVGPNIPGRYSNTRNVSVDPVTGAIVKGAEHQVRTLADGSTALDTTLTFNDAAVRYQAKQAKDGRSQITMLTVILPLILLVVGIAALVGAFLLLRNDDDHHGAHAARAAEAPEPTRV